MDNEKSMIDINDINNTNKTMLILYKNRGKFFNASGNDAFILNFLFGYKILKDNKCGFPEVAFNKVINKIEEEKISYYIVYNYKDPVFKDYKKLNNYSKVLEKALNNVSLNSRIDLLIEKIKKANEDDLKKILEYFEKCL